MATLLLRAAGTFVGGLIGGPFGAILGAVGSLGGFAIDQALLSKNQTRQGPRLEGMPLLNASEGGSIPRVYGYARAGGQIIWATRFREEQRDEKVGGGKGAIGGGTTVETFSYYANFAVAICEGSISGIRRVWADGQELDLTGIEMRVYRGTATQLPDPLIEAKQGFGKAPAYRGTAYVVFEGMPLEAYGNRIPQLSFEVMRPVGKLEPQIEAITIIPGASEYAYSPTEVFDEIGPGNTISLNRHVLHAASDWEASIDELQALCPNLKNVALVVSWFGTDLRAGHCRVEPKVEVAARPGASDQWKVSGVARAEASLVSQTSAGPAFGGTPSDASVLAAIADLKARGLKVTLYPFIMMDVPPGNGLPNPIGTGEQPAFPWRGRITDETDESPAVHSAVQSFVGSVSAADFVAQADTIDCLSTEMSYRRLILHYAHLCAAAGGVDAFIIGSELRGLTQLRDTQNVFPLVQALQSLAQDSRAVLGPATDITYAADWTEYFGYHPTDGSGDVFFHLDPLWAEPAITAVGIDNYMPLSDWRETKEAAIRDGACSAYDTKAMAQAVVGGEGFDWYYTDATDRAAGNRTTINSGDNGDEWLYRFKDLEGWWSNPHFDRRAGVAVTTPSPWMPQSKPIWFTELGAPAVDCAPNQPNVFPDPKSSENAFPYHSRAGRDDLAQRRFLEAHLSHWRSKTNGMVPTDRIYLWTWDARPQPAFPSQTEIWRDGVNWHLGHWLTGRLGGAPADDLLVALATDYGLEGIDASRADGAIDGLLLDGDHSARGVIEALSDFWGLSTTQVGQSLIIRSPNWTAKPTVILDEALVEAGDEPVLSFERLDESELPNRLSLSFSDIFSSYEAASVSVSRGASGQNTENVSLAVSLSQNTAQSRAAALLRSRWAGRDTVSFKLPPAAEGLRANDPVVIKDREYAVADVERGDAISVMARSTDRLMASAPVTQFPETRKTQPSGAAGVPDVTFLDLPNLPGTDETSFAAVSVNRWRGGYGLYSSAATAGFTLRANARRNAIAGRLLEDLPSSVPWRWVQNAALKVQLVQGSLSSQPDQNVLGGTNAIAVEKPNGWEIIQFSKAELIAERRYQLSGLLRGQNGTEQQMLDAAASGARTVVLNSALTPIKIESSDRGVLLNWRAVRTGELVSSPMAVSQSFAGGTRALRPLSPVHLRRNGNLFSWIRRDRLDADNWDQAEIPMSERVESYQVSLTDVASGVVLASQTVNESAFDASSFAQLPASVQLDVAQISAVTGPGDAASKIFST